MEPAASVPLLPVRLSSCGLLSSVRPCTLLNDKFFYRKTYYCLEPPPSVAVCGETEPAKCVVWCSVVLKKRWNYDNRTGCPWFHAVASLFQKLAVKKCTGRTFFNDAARKIFD